MILKNNMKLYFGNEDSNNCYCLEDHINEAKEDGLNEVELIEAVQDDSVKHFCWCTYLGDCIERSECSKKFCDMYKKPEKGNACANRGQFYSFGEKVRFDVNTGLEIKPNAVQASVK